MAVHWRLRLYLASRHGIYSATALQKRIAKRTGVLISLQNLCNYLHQKPKRIQMDTIELICSALDCKLSDFLEVEPRTYRSTTLRKLAPQHIPLSKKATKTFPDPVSYLP